ncbi:MAG TPA: GntR family transcriptional regulator [Candidatus Acidoferrum sp.]|nr:GntR family transcriptional regulator [Candidatus Acidoferrum sp.]
MADSAPILLLNDHQSLRERIVHRLRDAIVAGELPANSRLPEPELAKRLGVSRTPLREAIRQLAAEGFVSTVPRGSSFVSEVTPQDAEELYALRAVIEGLAARQAAENPDPTKRQILGELLDEMAKRKGDLRRYHEMSGRFHDAIVALSRNRRLQAIHEGVSLHVSRMRTLSLAGRGRPNVSLRDHRRIVAAILRGRGAEAEQLMRAHIEAARVIVKRRIGPERRGKVRE